MDFRLGLDPDSIVAAAQHVLEGMDLDNLPEDI